MKAAMKMMLTLAAVCLLMAVPAMGARNLLGAPPNLAAPAANRAHAGAVLCRVACCAACCVC